MHIWWISAEPYPPFFQCFLKGETQIPSDEAFHNAVLCYAEIFLRSERVSGIVAGGGLSQHDCREIFRHQIEKVDRPHAQSNRWQVFERHRNGLNICPTKFVPWSAIYWKTYIYIYLTYWFSLKFLRFCWLVKDLFQVSLVYFISICNTENIYSDWLQIWSR